MNIAKRTANGCAGRRAAARDAGGAAVPTSARKALAGKLQRAAASLKAKTPITKRAKKKPKPVKKLAKKLAKKKRATKAKPPGAKVVGRITPKVKSKDTTAWFVWTG